MSLSLIIQAERGQHPHGGDGYGYGIGDHLALLDSFLEDQDALSLTHFCYEDPEEILEVIEVMESLGQNVDKDRERYQAALKRPDWYSPSEALKSVAILRQGIPTLKLEIDHSEELLYDLDCYQESLEYLEGKKLRFRFR